MQKKVKAVDGGALCDAIYRNFLDIHFLKQFNKGFSKQSTHAEYVEICARRAIIRNFHLHFVKECRL
nr:hypothetical protein [Paenibacillus phytorum]